MFYCAPRISFNNSEVLQKSKSAFLCSACNLLSQDLWFYPVQSFSINCQSQSASQFSEFLEISPSGRRPFCPGTKHLAVIIFTRGMENSLSRKRPLLSSFPNGWPGIPPLLDVYQAVTGVVAAVWGQVSLREIYNLHIKITEIYTSPGSAEIVIGQSGTNLMVSELA